MAKNDIKAKQDGPVLRITLNQPKRGNAVTDDMVRELTRLIRGAPKKSDIVVLRGAGADFCVGRAGMGARPAVEPTAYTRRKFSDVVFDAYRPAIPYYNLRQVDARVPPLPDWLRDRPR